MPKVHLNSLYYVGDNIKQLFSVDILIPNEENIGWVDNRLVQDFVLYEYFLFTLFRIISISECNIVFTFYSHQRLNIDLRIEQSICICVSVTSYNPNYII